MPRLPDAIRHSLRQARNIRRIVVSVTMISPVAVGVLRLYADQFGMTGIVLTVVFLTLGLIAGLILLFVSNDAADVADDLLSQLDANRLLKRQTVSLKDAVGRASARHAFLQGLADLAYAAPKTPEIDDIRRLNESTLELLATLHDKLFEIGSKEKWGYCIYLFNAEAGRLACLGWKRAWREDRGHIPRSWEPGKGHVGVAYARKGDLVYGDASEATVKQLIEPGDQPSARDENYRSVASIPIFDGNDSVLGVVVATSNRKDRYRPDQKAELEPLRDWARFNANLIARQRQE